MEIESHLRSVVKSISYRLLGSLATAILVFLLSNEFRIAAIAGSMDAVLKLVIFYVHERVWGRVRFGKIKVEPKVIWFTGLSGSGKTTIAKGILDRLSSIGIKVEHLDGDSIRSLFSNNGYDRNSRNEHVKRVGMLAAILEKNGVFVVTSLISPYNDARNEVRQLCNNFIEVHLSTPLEACEKRDVKGLYARARRGEITNFTGIDDPYESPANPEIVIDTTHITPAQAVDEVIRKLKLGVI